MDLKTFILWIVALALITVNITFLATNDPVGDGSHKWTYAEFVSVSLTAVTVVLAALALGVGALAIWGFKQIEDRAKDAAAEKAGGIASDKIESYLNSEAFRLLAKAALKQMEAEKVSQNVTGDDKGASIAERRTGDGGTGNEIPKRPTPR